MATELALVEGLQYAAAHTMSGGTVYAGLIHTKTVGAGTITSAATLAGLASEVSGTGYARQALTLGAASSGIIVVPSVTWNPASATDWNTDVTACFIASAASGGVAIFVWDLSASRDMSKANANLVIPSTNYFFENPGGI